MVYYGSRVVKASASDNAVMESFYRTLKVELICQYKYQTRIEAQRDIFELHRNILQQGKIIFLPRLLQSRGI